MLQVLVDLKCPAILATGITNIDRFVSNESKLAEVDAQVTESDWVSMWVNLLRSAAGQNFEKAIATELNQILNLEVPQDEGIKKDGDDNSVPEVPGVPQQPRSPPKSQEQREPDKDGLLTLTEIRTMFQAD